MMSPWLDLNDPQTSQSWIAGRDYDYLRPALVTAFATAYAGELAFCEVSPCNLRLEGLPPLLIAVGDCELLRDQGVTFAERARAAGVDVELRVEPGMVHVFLILASVSAPDTPPNQIFKHVACFLERVVGKGSAVSP